MRTTFWTQAPMIRLLIPLVCGISLALRCPVNVHFGILWSCAIGLIIPVLPVWKWPYRFRWIPGLSLHFSIGIFGILMQITHNEFFQKHHFTRATDPVYCMARLTDQGIAKKASKRYGADILSIADSVNKWHPAKGKILLYVRNDSLQKDTGFVYGEVVIFPYKSIQEVPPPSNPDEFDYKLTLALQNIHFTAYLEKSVLQHTGYTQCNPIQVWVFRMQHYFTAVLCRYIGKASETAVVQALLYGYDDEIEPEIVQAFAQTGTLHVLAVSGMHVGMIFLILSFLLKPMMRFRRLKGLKNLLLLCALWFYAALCGLTPSILRATVMFSFILIGTMLKRTGNIFNTLGASAFFLLCFNPGMLFNTGFQLSYLAVGGIVFFHPLIFNWFTPESRPGLEIWKLLSVSLAAQIATFPVSLLFFHQFPVCFLLSNLLMIPLTSIILYGAIVLLVVSGIPELSEWLGFFLCHLVQLTNKTVILLSQIPYAYVDRIPFDFTECLLLYGLTLLITLFLIQPQRLYLTLSLLALLSYILLNGLYKLHDSRQIFVTVYKIPKQSAIRLVHGRESILWGDSSTLLHEKQMQFYIRGHELAHRLETSQTFFLDEKWKLIHLDKICLLINGKGNPDPKPLSSLVLILRFAVDTQVLANMPIRQVIFTSSIKPLAKQKLQKYFNCRHIPCVAVSDSGAITLNLRNNYEQPGTLSRARPRWVYYP